MVVRSSSTVRFSVIAGDYIRFMAIELTQGVSARLNADDYGWLTTITRSGQPVPKLVWFHFDGTDVVIHRVAEMPLAE